MQTKYTTLSTKVNEIDKIQFDRIANNLGCSSAAALKMFIKQFIEHRGFPFEVAEAKQGVKSIGYISKSGITVLPQDMYFEGDDGLYDSYFS